MSNYVLIAQDDLNTLGYRTNGLDGIFGVATYNAVVAYQRSRGLTVDGIVGCNTWRSLHKDVTLQNGKEIEQVIPESIEIKKVFLAEKNPVVRLGMIIK